MPRQIKFNCVHCGTKLAVPPQMAGVSDHCPKCGGLITSPTLAEWQASLNAAAAAANTSVPEVPQTSSPTAVSTPGWSAKELAETFHPPEVEINPTLPPAARQPAEPVPAPVHDTTTPISDGISTIRIKSPANPSASPPSSSRPPEPATSVSAAPPAPLPGETILSRMLNHPQTIKKNIPPSTWSSDPPSEATENTSSLSEHLPSASESSPLFSDAAADPPEHQEAEEVLGMGEALAHGADHSHSLDQPGPSLKPLRSTPFLSIQEVKKSKLRRPSFARRVLVVLLYVLVFDALLVLIFRKQLVEMWHTHVVGTASQHESSDQQEPTSLPAPSSTPVPSEPSSHPAAVPAPPEKLPPPEAGPADFPSTTTQGGPAPFQPMMPGIQGDLPHSAVATASPSASSAVPQAIPITEEQLAKLPPSSLGVTPPATATAPPPPATFEVAGEPADAPPPAMAPSSAKPVAPAANDPANAPFAVSDAWVFPQATGAEKFETPAKATPPGTSPATTMVESPSPAGLPPPPPDMALPNGPAPPSAMEAVPAPPPPALKPVSTPSLSTPAASASASSEKPISNRIPPEAKPAYDALLAFLEATDWRQRAKYSLRASQLGDAMATHAKAYGDGPISVRNIDFLERHAKTSSSDPYCMFELRGGDLKDNILVLVAQPSKGPPLVDWESFVEFRHDYLLKFLQTNTAPKQRFRVMLRRKHYFDKDVPDMEKKDSFEVSQPSAKYQGHVFIQKGTTLSSTLATQLGWGLDMPVIIELTWKSSKNHHWVEIVSIPHYGWRNS